MNWKQDRFSYYFDFVFSPIIAAGAAARIAVTGNTFNQISLGVLGLVLWTFLEYWVHRLLFHRFFRAAHDLHHDQPGGYDAVPAWMTMPIHVALLCALAYASALGVFVGMEIGYLLYILTHDKIHHSATKRGWLRRRWQHHRLHHQGVEANFGVAVHWWDRVFGTYIDPSKPARRDLTSSS